jgi:O-antigen/teichoic acid export membrane protein
MSLLEKTAPPRVPLAGNRGFWLLADQGVVSLGTFATNVLLARSLAPAQYGTYTILLGVLYFLNGLHSGLLIYPLTLKVATAAPPLRKHLGGTGLCFTLALAAPLAAVAVAAAVLLGQPLLAPWVCAALVAWQLQETLRRALIAQFRHRDALWGDGLSYLGQALTVWVVCRNAPPALSTIFALMTGTSLAALTVQIFQVSPALAPATLGRFARDFWDLGRWTLLSGFFSQFNVYSLPWSLAIFHGPTASASFEAVNTLLKPVNPLIHSINGLVLPAAARASSLAGQQGAFAVGLRTMGQLGGLLLVWFLPLLMRPREALGFFYGGESPYLAHTGELRLWVLFTALYFVAQTLGAAILGAGRSRAHLTAELISTAVSLALGIALVAHFALTGLIAAALCAVVARLIALALIGMRGPLPR